MEDSYTLLIFTYVFIFVDYSFILFIIHIQLDPHYQQGATIKSGCHNQPKTHRKKKQRKGKLSGYWGAPTSDCDSSEPWVYHAIKTIADDWRDKIDFIVWTGDNAR